MKFISALLTLCLLACHSPHGYASENAQSGAAPVPLQAKAPSPGDSQTSTVRGEVNPGDRTCSADEDCALVQVGCSSCCPPPSDFDAVNKLHAKDYENMGCTIEHVRSCGVPECGMAGPEPYPEAVCHQGACVMNVHPPHPREPVPAPPAGK